MSRFSKSSKFRCLKWLAKSKRRKKMMTKPTKAVRKCYRTAPPYRKSKTPATCVVPWSQMFFVKTLSQDVQHSSASHHLESTTWISNVINSKKQMPRSTLFVLLSRPFPCHFCFATERSTVANSNTALTVGKPSHRYWVSSWKVSERQERE